MKNEFKDRRWTVKRQGETAQLLFRAQASLHGFTVLDPYGDSGPYDVALQYGDGPILRIQVKSTVKPRVGGVYGFHLRGGRGKKAYTSKQFEFLAAYIFPEERWYLIPVRALHRDGVRLKSLLINHAGQQENKWIDFQEAWDDLRKPNAGRSLRQRRGAGRGRKRPSADSRRAVTWRKLMRKRKKQSLLTGGPVKRNGTQG